LLLALLNKSVFQQVMLVCIKFRFVCCPQMADCRWSLSIKRWDSVGEFQSVGRINRCGLAMLHKLAGANPVQVIASHEPGIEPCRHIGNDVLDA